ncbi:hypothetical protein PBCVCvsA1_025R [Paramecium bursaria Chlorella virus CvsA1]|nr:hypothetical protein PBCVCvsA1_025R [Paramecium bursaria Chlorella virus CvsA1]
MLYPITFSIPKEKIVNKMTAKTKLISDLIPGDKSTYIYDTEESYYAEYKKSLFAVTRQKGGWDCLRHYEIMACGAVPLFMDIENCPQNTLSLMPKNLLIEANNLFERLRSKHFNLVEQDIKEYSALRKQLLDHTRKHLTTEAVASYVLDKSNHKNAKRVLCLSGITEPDYLRCLTLHGFKSLNGVECHDFPKVPHLYETEDIGLYGNIYGKGITYANNLRPETHDDSLDESVIDDIKNKKYDVIIYPSYHRGMPYYDLVCSVYKPEEIILLCGEDIHQCTHDQWTVKGHHVFVRELI